MTIFLLIKHKERFLLFRPLSPEALKTSINELGASFIKLAQVLATRADLFDDIYLEELRSLHDEIPPMSSEDFQKVYRSAFPWLHENLFYFLTMPLCRQNVYLLQNS